jgi:hypothetical protein
MRLRLCTSLGVWLVGAAIGYGQAAAQNVDTTAVYVVRPSGVAQPPAAEPAPGGVVVLRGGGQADAASAPPPQASPRAAPVPREGWHEYDTGGFDRRYDAGGYDHNYDRSGLSPP